MLMIDFNEFKKMSRFNCYIFDQINFIKFWLINEKRQFDCIDCDNFSSTIENEMKNELRIDRLQRKKKWKKNCCVNARTKWRNFDKLSKNDLLQNFKNCIKITFDIRCVWFCKLSWKFFYSWRLISDVKITDVDFSTS